MNNCLLDELDKSNVKILFKHKLVKVDTLNACRMTFIDGHNDAKTSTLILLLGVMGPIRGLDTIYKDNENGLFAKIY